MNIHLPSVAVKLNLNVSIPRNKILILITFQVADAIFLEIISASLHALRLWNTELPYFFVQSISVSFTHNVYILYVNRPFSNGKVSKVYSVTVTRYKEFSETQWGN